MIPRASRVGKVSRPLVLRAEREPLQSAGSLSSARFRASSATQRSDSQPRDAARPVLRTARRLQRPGHLVFEKIVRPDRPGACRSGAELDSCLRCGCRRRGCRRSRPTLHTAAELEGSSLSGPVGDRLYGHDKSSEGVVDDVCVLRAEVVACFDRQAVAGDTAP
jgi:hypothetical protein